MTQFDKPLFSGKHLRLAAVDMDKDAVIEAEWSYDLDYAMRLRDGLPRPLAAFELVELYQKLAKQTKESKMVVHFAIRLKEDDRLIGFLRIQHINWNHANGRMALVIAAPDDRHCYGQEALDLALRYAFQELNLFRLEVHLPEYEADTIALYNSAGFRLEVRQRELLYRNGRYWDQLIYAMLQEDWRGKQFVMREEVA